MTGPANLDLVVPAAWRGEPPDAGSVPAAASGTAGPRLPSAIDPGGEPSSLTLVHHAIGAAAMAVGEAGAGRHLRLVMAAGIALLAHVGLLLALERFPQAAVGAGGFDIEAVSIEVALLPATAMESRAAAVAAAAGETVAASDGSEAAQPAQAASAPAVKEVALPPAAEAALVLLEAKPEPLVPDRLALPAAEKLPEVATKPAEPQPEPVAKAEAKVEPRQPVERAEPQKREVQAEKPKEPAPAAEELSPAAMAAAEGGGAARAATREQQPSAGIAAASPGQIAAYARSVVGALAKSAPKGAPAAVRGTVRVVFAIAPDGGIEDVRIKQSSGRPRLDDLAVAAVRATRFPAPPAGMALAERTYEIPYHFR